MGYAIAEGAVKSGVIKGSTVIAGDPFRLESKRQKWEALGITCSRNNAKVAASCKMLILSRVRNPGKFAGAGAARRAAIFNLVALARRGAPQFSILWRRRGAAHQKFPI